jgi:chondroitin 4-sulfotransferase 11
MKYYLPRRLYLRYLLHSDSMAPNDRSWLAAAYRTANRLYRWRRDPYRPQQRDLGAIYIHVPKTGGVSVKHMIYGPHMDGVGLHAPAWEYQNRQPDLYDRMFVFATIRHPLLRMQSAFCFLKCGGMRWYDKRWADRWLADYSNVTDMLRAMRDPAIRFRTMRWVHFIPQRYFVCDLQGNVLVDRLVRTEDFAADMRKICDRLHQPFQELHENATPNRQWHTAQFDEETVRLCYAFYRQDYELFGYDPWPPQPVDQGMAAATPALEAAMA